MWVSLERSFRCLQPLYNMKHFFSTQYLKFKKFKNKYLLKRNLPTPVGFAERNFFNIFYLSLHLSIYLKQIDLWEKGGHFPQGKKGGSLLQKGIESEFVFHCHSSYYQKSALSGRSPKRRRIVPPEFPIPNLILPFFLFVSENIPQNLHYCMCF